ncbi:MAG: hypothetical protein ACI959_001001 [Limisphaerales bacterium]|jgi:hypothetical protein
MDLLVQILLFFIMGVLFYFIDSRLLGSLYRWWYGMTNKEGLPEGVTKGFVSEREVGVRVGWAIFFTGVGAAITLVSGSFFNNSTDVVLTLMALFVGATLGFLAAPYVLKYLPGKVESATDYLDKVESGEKKVTDDLKSAAGAATKNLAGMAADGSEKIREVASEVKKEVFDAADDARDKIKGLGDVKKRQAERDEKKADKKDDSDSDGNKDWRSGVKDFIDK